MAKVKAEKAAPVKAAKVVKEKEVAAPKGEVSGNMLETLKALKGGKQLTHDTIAGITGRTKGNKLRELIEKGFVKSGEEEGVRGYVYQVTPNGLKALAKS